MKTNQEPRATRIPSVALLLTVVALVSISNAQAAGQLAGDVKATITFDHEHTSIVNRILTGEGINELRGDNPAAATVSYVDGGKIIAAVGSNRHIWLDGNTSSKVINGRSLYLDLADALGCDWSGNVDKVFDGICDPCVDTTPLLPDSRFGELDTDDVAGFPDNFDFIVVGEDYDDLRTDCIVNTWARLKFDIGNHKWYLIWGPYKTHRAGGNQNSADASAVQATRISASQWQFQTTGNHLAALYQSFHNDGLGNPVYHGQFRIKFSGTAVALPNQTLPPPLHCDIRVVPGDSDPFCSP